MKKQIVNKAEEVAKATSFIIYKQTDVSQRYSNKVKLGNSCELSGIANALLGGLRNYQTCLYYLRSQQPIPKSKNSKK